MDALFWGAVILVALLIAFVSGYMLAAREFGKEVRFLKDCSERQRNTIVGYMEEVDVLQRKLRG